MIATRRLLLMLVLAVGGLAVPAHARQYLVGPGDNWKHIAPSLRPGDEIILMPGRHRPCVLQGIQGTGKRPIVIRGLTPDKPSLIVAKAEGLRLVGVQHVIIKDLVISGARINGISVLPSLEPGATRDGPWRSHLTLQNVTIEQTGPTGRRHGLQVTRVNNVRVIDCTFDGWGGAAIDLVTAGDIEITGCRFKGRSEFSQNCGIHARAGTVKVDISDCHLTGTGVYGIMIGGRGDRGLGIPGAGGGKDNNKSRYEAERVVVRRCLIEGSACPVLFRSANECQVRNMTIHKPKQWVMAVDFSGDQSPIAVPSANLAFGRNLIVWEPGKLQAIIFAPPRYARGTLKIEQNLWWAGEAANPADLMAALPDDPVFAQLVDVDPMLDEDLRPTSRRAALFGSFAP